MKTFKTIYDHADPVSPHGDEQSLTDQQYLDECDVNSILKRYRVTGQLPVNRVAPVYGDFSDMQDFQTCLDRVQRAKDAFDDLPSELRARFGNDPRQYVSFCLDPSNEEECVRLGLREAPAVEEPSTADLLKQIVDNTKKDSVTPKADITA